MQFADDSIHSRRELHIAITEIIYCKFVYMVALHNSIYMGLNATAKESAVILAGFHHYRKVSQLYRTVINIQTIKIVFYNACHRFTGSIAVGFINLHQHIKHIRKDMTGTGAWVNDFQLIRCQRGVFLANLGKLCLHFRLLLSFFQIVVPFGIFRVTVSGSISRLFFLCRQKLLFHIWVSLQPQTTKTVLHHVANNPVRCEKLGCCRNVFFCNFHILFQSCENIVFFLAVIILIQPANDLDSILPIILWYQLNHLLNDTAFTEQIVRQKKLGVICYLLEHSRQNLIQGVALHNQQIFIQFFGLFRIFQLIDFFHIESIQIQMNGFGYNLRPKIVFLVRDYTHMGRKIAVDFHESQSRETVEPSVGNLLHDLFISFIVNLSNESLTLLLFISGEDFAANTIRIGILNVVLCDTVFHTFQGNTGDQLCSCPDSKFFNRILIHTRLSSLVQLDLIAIFQELLQLRTNLLYIIINVFIRL